MGHISSDASPAPRSLHEVTLSPTGALVEIAYRHGQHGRHSATKRGKVAHFSKGARKRLYKRIGCVPTYELSRGLFITLTYPANYPEKAGEWKAHLDRFAVALRRMFPRVSFVWKMEPQARGAPHFHLLTFNHRFLPVKQLSELWYRVVGSNDPNHLLVGVDIAPVRHAVNAIKYVGKYIAKAPDSTGPATNKAHSWAYPGRWWGVVGRKDFPVDRRTYAVSAEQWHAVLRRAKYVAQGTGLPDAFGGHGGGFLLTDTPTVRRIHTILSPPH